MNDLSKEKMNFHHSHMLVLMLADASLSKCYDYK